MSIYSIFLNHGLSLKNNYEIKKCLQNLNLQKSKKEQIKNKILTLEKH